MKYISIKQGLFLDRPNRFVANIVVDGAPEKVHVKNTGRCRELLIPGATVYLEDFAGRMGNRKMRYSLIAVQKGNLLVNMDSQAPNKVVAEALKSGKVQIPGFDKPTLIKAEKTWGNSRFDFYLQSADGREAYIEVKGVTLEHDGVVSFPDAPTERGIKHLEELQTVVTAGHTAAVVFVVQMCPVKYFRPNDENHEAFGNALRVAEKAGVLIYAYDCKVEPDAMTIENSVTIKLTENGDNL